MIKINDSLINQDHFSSGELKLYFPIISFDTTIKIEWYYENDAELFTLICIKRYLDEHYPKYNCILYMPYMGHARMDRTKNEEDIFTLKYFCEIINSLNFAEVRILDAHSNVGPALLSNVTNQSAFPCINRAIDKCDNGNLTLFFPDEGAMKRYSDLFPTYKYAFGIKKRNWETQEIEGLSIIYPENVKDKDILIIDDICSYGNTFVRAAAALKETGAKSINLYITHCENAIIKGDVFKVIDRVFTTNSLVHTDEVKEKIEYVCEE